MEEEIIFNGTPSDFVIFTDEVESEVKRRCDGTTLMAYDPHQPGIDFYVVESKQVVVRIDRRIDIHSGRVELLEYVAGWISASRIPRKRSRVVFKSVAKYESLAVSVWKVLLEHMQRYGYAGVAPAKPAEPPTSSSLEDWLAWYHNMKKAGFKVSLEDIAARTKLSPGHIRNVHAGCEEEVCQKRRSLTAKRRNR